MIFELKKKKRENRREGKGEKCQKDLINHYRIPFDLNFYFISFCCLKSYTNERPEKSIKELKKGEEKNIKKLDWNVDFCFKIF